MEQVLSYRIPVLHPLLVHFPIAFSLCVALVIGLWVVTDRQRLLVWAAWGQVLVLMGTWAAWWTGDEMKAQSEGVQIVEELVGLHEQMADWSLWMAAVLLVVLWATVWRTSRDMSRSGTAWYVRCLVGAAALVFAGLIAWVSHIGGVMVWGIPAS